MKAVGVANLVPDQVLAELYQDDLTCRSVVRAVNRYERDGVIDGERAKAILLLGEPAVYGALAELRDSTTAE